MEAQARWRVETRQPEQGSGRCCGGGTRGGGGASICELYVGEDAAAAIGDPSTTEGAAAELPSASAVAGGATTLGADGFLLRSFSSCLELYFRLL
jgi:hypothetical protein